MPGSKIPRPDIFHTAVDKHTEKPHSMPPLSTQNTGVIPLANTVQAKKRAKQAEDHRKRNTSARSEMRSAVKKVVNAIESGNKTLAAEAYKAAVPAIDKMVNKGLVHRNKASRHKSRLNQHIRTLQG
jgi:small subunit ribosomal protein S20